MIENFEQLLKQAKKSKPVSVSIAAANDSASIGAVAEAINLGLATAILCGDAEQIKQSLKANGLNASHSVQILNADTPETAADLAIEQIHKGNAHILLKGQIKTAQLLKRVLDKEKGLRSGQLLSDVFLFEVSSARTMMITDGGVNLKPDLGQKVEILKNAVQVGHALGNSCPRVALLSAIEVVNPDIPSTLQAAMIAKMNQRKQIKGCLVDGPLALDNAVSLQAAETKGIDSPVAGRADILVCPDIESANMLAKSTTYFAELKLAHVIVGAKVPVLIPSRADSSQSKLYSIALGKLFSEYLQKEKN